MTKQLKKSSKKLPKHTKYSVILKKEINMISSVLTGINIKTLVVDLKISTLHNSEEEEEVEELRLNTQVTLAICLEAQVDFQIFLKLCLVREVEEDQSFLEGKKLVKRDRITKQLCMLH